MFPRRLVVLDGVARGEEGHRLVSRRQEVAEGFAREPSGQGVTRLLRRRGAFSFQQPERPAVVDAPAGAAGLSVDHVADLVVGAGVGFGAVFAQRCVVLGDLAQKAAGQCLLERKETLVLVHPGHPAKILEVGGTTQDGRGRKKHRSVGTQPHQPRQDRLAYTGGTIPPGAASKSTVHPPASPLETSTPRSTRAKSVSLKKKGWPPVLLRSHPPKRSRRTVPSPSPSRSGDASDRTSRTVSSSVRGPRRTRLMGRSWENPARLRASWVLTSGVSIRAAITSSTGTLSSTHLLEA